jgi:hypothetical protein
LIDKQDQQRKARSMNTTPKPTFLKKIGASAENIHDTIAILSSLQPIVSLEPSVQPLNVMPLGTVDLTDYFNPLKQP